MGALGSIPGSGRSPGQGNGNPLQYSCLENSMDRGVWWAIVHGVAKSQVMIERLTNTHTDTLQLFLWFYSDTEKGEFLKPNIQLNRWFYDGVMHSHVIRGIYSHWLIYLVEAAHAFCNSSWPCIACVQHGPMKIWTENCFLVSLCGRKVYIDQMVLKFKLGYTYSMLLYDSWVTLVTN